MQKNKIISFLDNKPETAVTVIKADFRKDNEDQYIFDKHWRIYEAVYNKDAYYYTSRSELKKYWTVYTQNKLSLLSELETIDGITSISNYNGNIFAKVENGNPKGFFILTRTEFAEQQNLKTLKVSCEKNGFDCKERSLSYFVGLPETSNDSSHTIINLLIGALKNINDKGEIYKCTNLDSDCYIFNDKWTRSQKGVDDERFNEMVICLRISTGKGGAAELAVTTFSRLDKLKELYKNNKKMLSKVQSAKRYKRIDEGGQAELVPTYELDLHDNEYYVKYTLDRHYKHSIEDEVFNGVETTSKGPCESDCKNGIFVSIIHALNEIYHSYAIFSYPKGRVIRTKKLKSHSTRENTFKNRISNFQNGQYQLQIIDTLEPFDEKKRLVNIFRTSLSEFLGIDENNIGISSDIKKNQFNFAIIHDKDYFKYINRIEKDKAKKEGLTPNIIDDKYLKIEGFQNDETGYLQNITIETLNLNKSKDKNTNVERIKPYLLRALLNEILTKKDVAEGEVPYKIDDDVIFGMKKVVEQITIKERKKEKRKIPIYLIMVMTKNSNSFKFYINVGAPEFDLGERTNDVARAFDRIPNTKDDNFVVSTSKGTSLMITADFKCIREKSKKPQIGKGLRSRQYRQDAMPALYDINLFELEGNYYIISGYYPESSRNLIIEKTYRPRLIECISGDCFELAQDVLNYVGEIYLGPNGPGAYPFAAKIMNEIHRQWMLDKPDLRFITENNVDDEDDETDDINQFELFEFEDAENIINDIQNNKLQTIVSLTLPSTYRDKFEQFAHKFKSTSAAVRYILRLHYNIPAMWTDMPENETVLFNFEEIEICKDDKIATTVFLGTELYEKIKTEQTDNLSNTLRIIVMNYLKG